MVGCLFHELTRPLHTTKNGDAIVLGDGGRYDVVLVAEKRLTLILLPRKELRTHGHEALLATRGHAVPVFGCPVVVKVESRKVVVLRVPRKRGAPHTHEQGGTRDTLDGRN